MQRGSCRCRAPTVLRQGKGTHAGDGVPPRATGEWWRWSPATVELQAARGKAATGKRRSWNRPEKELETLIFFARRYGVGLSFNAHFFAGSRDLFCWKQHFLLLEHFFQSCEQLFFLEAVIFCFV